jgi:hypothetical protein
MTTLSPAAQAVVAAIEKFDWESGHFSREEIWFCSREVVAAALRAAADQASPEKQVKDIDYVHQMYTDGMKDALAVLQEIADELEGPQ